MILHRKGYAIALHPQTRRCPNPQWSNGHRVHLACAVSNPAAHQKVILHDVLDLCIDCQSTPIVSRHSDTQP